MAQSKPKDAMETLITEVRARVTAGPTNPIPSKFTFDSENNKILFLCSVGGVSSLHSVDFDVSVAATTEVPKQEMVPFLSSGELRTAKTMSLEEELLRERKREKDSGITDYSFEEGSHTYLIPCSGAIYQLKTSKEQGKEKEIKEYKEIVSSSSPRLDAKLSSDGKFLSFIRSGDIWLTNGEKEWRLTYANLDESKCKSAGVAEYIIQEEFDRFTGYSWSPKVIEEENNKQIYSILFFEVDESEVEIYRIPKHSFEGKVDEFRYPLAGRKNATSKVKMVQFSPREDGELDITVKEIKPNLSELFPWCEYVPRFGWFPSGNRVWISLLDRVQQYLLYISISLNEFFVDYVAPSQSNSNHTHFNPENNNNNNNNTTTTTTNNNNKTDGKSKIVELMEEKTPVWINITNFSPIFINDEKEIIWANEQSGFRHLHLLNLEKKETKQITAGDWQVDRHWIKYDEKHKCVFFMGTKDTPLESHLYVASLSLSPSPENNFNAQRLTEPNFTHNVKMLDNTHFISVHSNLTTDYQIGLFEIQHPNENSNNSGGGVVVVVVRKLLEILPPIGNRRIVAPLPPPEFFNFQNPKGETIYGCYYKPEGFNPNTPYPTLVYVYGGPHVQLVTNSFGMMGASSLNYRLANAMGFLVVIMDGVGSDRRGLKFEGQIHKKMGRPEVEDQVAGVKFLASKGLVDSARVAISGWSYGGYMSLMCLSQAPLVFKIAVVGAPVTDWRYYDTGYTERYMGLPDKDAAAYDYSSVVLLADQFPYEENRLLMVHGLLDENVHFCNTSILIEKFNKFGIPFTLHLFPDERHGVRNPSNLLQWQKKWLGFLKTHL
eukprot:TRINITY_DN3213_c0_g1_i1.p1 TRINITY_DN3213_c0_g1~~TRINITY_DN3213_c0_g1_i1.p1  ORF type:complete len:830 (-),score=267.30 TRINITY_DN3213_c0_g1_i1:40-2529(-)